MRNCFVPHCDAYCKQKKIEKRMMFIPPRDENILNTWKSKLYNKRVLHEKDKVCERHFTKDEILTHWDHKINGTIVKLERDKPKLKPTAIPTLNLPEMYVPDNIFANSDEEDEVRKRFLKRQLARKPAKKSNVENGDEARLRVVVAEIEKSTKADIAEDVVMHEDDEIVLLQVTDAEAGSDTDADTCDNDKAIFESIFDDVFEVVLPSTLWGIHRDPERKFIAFSEFDANTMSTVKLLYVSSSLELKTFLHNVELQKSKRPDLSVETLTAGLNELDDTRACETLKLGLNLSECQIVVDEGDYCRTCTKSGLGD